MLAFIESKVWFQGREMVKLYVDNRERGIIDNLRETGVEFGLRSLDIGDIAFLDDEENTVLIIERKTVPDLKASIIDGRRSEQKARLKTIPRERIIYLIEGDLNYPLEDEEVYRFKVSTLIGSVINTQLRDGIHVYKTSCLDETCEYLRALLNKLNKDLDNFFKPQGAPAEGVDASAEYCATLSKSKKANMTQEVWFIAQLCLIPQITEKIAVEIVRKYPTPRSLWEQYERSDAGENLLADITYPVKGGKIRRVGPKNSERIYNYFYRSDTTE